MATTLDQLVIRVRRFMRDYPPPVDALTASVTSSATTFAIADTTQIAKNYVVEIDYEDILVKSISTATSFVGVRGYAGSTAASHANSAALLLRPGYFAPEIIDALNAAKDEMYPYCFKPVLDTSLTAVATQYEYTIPSTILHLSEVEEKLPGDTAYRKLTDWDVKRAATPVLIFRRVPVVGSTLRLHGYGPFADLALSADTLDTLFPVSAIQPLTLGAASRLLGSGEAGRTRFDSGIRDDREAALKPGAAISLANQLERRFEKALLRAAMPPFGKNCVSVL